MSSSDSESSSCSSRDSATGWPWQIGDCRQSQSDEFDSSSENSSDESSVEETINDSWTNRRNIFISVYKTNNYKDITLITNYNELHNYRDKYTKLSKKNPDNIMNIWNEVKINVPELGIIPLKLYEKDLIEDTKAKNKTVKKPTIVSQQNGSVVDKTKPLAVTKNQSSKATQKSLNSQQETSVISKVDLKADKTTQATNVASKDIKEKNCNETTKNTENSSNVKTKNKENVSNQKNPAETPTIAEKSTEENKTAAVSTTTKVDKQDKGVKVDILVLNVTKSESDKKNKTQSTNTTVQLNGSNKNVKSNSNAKEFKKPQTKSDSKKNKNSKNNTKEIIPETKSQKRKQKNSNSQSSENSDIQKRSNSVDSRLNLKKKSKKKIEESDNDTTDSDDEHEEIIDNMDELTGNAKAVKSRVKNKMTKLVKYKDKMKPVETSKIAEKKTNEKDNEQNAAVTPVKNDINLSTSEKNNALNSEKFAEESVDMIMAYNLVGGLESLLEAMQYNPGDDRHYLNRCHCYLQMNKPALALADAQYVLQTSSHYGHRFIAYLRAGKALMALQKYTQAENYFKDSLSINSDNVYAQRECLRAKIARITSLGYTERSAVLALLKYSKTQEAINYLANKNIAKSDNNDQNYDDYEDSDDLVYSSDVDEKPNCATLINNMLNYEPIKTKLLHLLAKPINMASSTSLPPSKNANGDCKNKNTIDGKTSTGQVMEKTIWVGSLTKNITETVLKKKFRLFGNVVSVYCPPNEAYAFVNFEKSEHVTSVLQNPSAQVIDGHKVVIRQGLHKK